ncbi:uncharacterized protein UV8b_04799 [Ustilaginoidea virens]|uniref:Uncharacterized protein n=1 Tax=Ustilaginoidea virens TaxID=1159556 RepID=A0A8E5HSH3_USTVR|nr:uncharacterized protein UV8b_04799 [Ustilaginoidea virens]QUC20558.1 hypothetical protein UV8b_04799 [Ustilaginoidea virens]
MGCVTTSSYLTRCLSTLCTHTTLGRDWELGTPRLPSLAPDGLDSKGKPGPPLCVHLVGDAAASILAKDVTGSPGRDPPRDKRPTIWSTSAIASKPCRSNSPPGTRLSQTQAELTGTQSLKRVCLHTMRSLAKTQAASPAAATSNFML